MLMLFSLSFMSQVVRYERTSLVEQTEAHVLILRLLLLLLLSGGMAHQQRLVRLQKQLEQRRRMRQGWRCGP